MKYLLSCALVLLFAASTLQADVSETKEYSYEIRPGGRISVSNVNGDIKVGTGNGRQVTIVATKKAGKQAYLDALEIVIDASDDSIRIETKHPKSNGSWMSWGNDSSGSVSYELTVPADVELDSVDTVNGAVRVSGVTGTVNLDSVNGRLEVTGAAGDVSADTVNGTIDIEFATLGAGQRVSADAVNGRITLRMPASASARIHAETLNGGIDADDFGLEPEKGGFVGRDLDGSIGAGDARINVDTVNGSINIRKTK